MEINISYHAPKIAPLFKLSAYKRQSSPATSRRLMSVEVGYMLISSACVRVSAQHRPVASTGIIFEEVKGRVGGSRTAFQIIFNLK